MKITKAEWDRFWEAMGPDWFMDGHDVSPEDEDSLAPGDWVTFTSGAIGWHGEGAIATTNGIVQQRDIKEGNWVDLSLVTAVKRWQKAQTTATVAVEIPKDKAEALAEAVKALGGKVLK